MPAQATAKRVMASAKRLIEVRHCWFNRNKIAEISVPAWPIPIHQTKLTIAKPQPIGTLIPQIPTPLVINQAIDPSSTIINENAMLKRASHPIDVGRVNTIDEILLVTDSYVCPGARTRGNRGSSGALISRFPALMHAPSHPSNPDAGCALRLDTSFADAH